MRSVLAFGIALGLALPAAAQGLPEQPPERKVHLEIAVEEARLIVQTLGAIQCATVAQLAVCTKAAALLDDIRRQVIAQERK